MEETSLVLPFPMDESKESPHSLPNPFLPTPSDVYRHMFPEPPPMETHTTPIRNPTISMAMSYRCRIKWETHDHRIRGNGSWYPMTMIRDMEEEAKVMNEKYPTLHHWVETGTIQGILAIEFLSEKIIDLYSIKSFTPTPLVVANEELVDILFKKGYYANLNEKREILSIVRR